MPFFVRVACHHHKRIRPFFFRNSHFDSYNIAICEWRVWKTKEGSTELHIILSLFGQNAYIRNHLIMFLYQLYRKQMLCIIMCLSSLCVENKNEVSPMPKQGQTKFCKTRIKNLTTVKRRLLHIKHHPQIHIRGIEIIQIWDAHKLIT